jgi:hypothetical protein
MAEQICPAERQQRTHEPPLHRCHPRETGGTGAFQHTHQDSLDLVVGMMAGENKLCTHPNAHTFQPGIPSGSGQRFPSRDTQFQAAALEWKAIRQSEISYLLRRLVALRMDAVVYVRHPKLHPVLPNRRHEEVEEGNGIRSSRHCHEGAAWLELQTGEMLSEPFGQ